MMMMLKTMKTFLVIFIFVVKEEVNGLDAPTLAVSSKKPLLGSELTLTCQAADDVNEFNWYKGVSPIVDNENKKVLKYKAVTSENGGMYKCEIKKGDPIKVSDEIKIEVAESMEKPTVQIKDATGNEVKLNKEMEFLCNSVHASTSSTPLTYKWTKECEDIPDAKGSSYKIEKVSNTDAGKYRCTTFFNTFLQTSDAFELKVVGGVAQMSASVLVVMIAAVVSRLL